MSSGRVSGSIASLEAIKTETKTEQRTVFVIYEGERTEPDYFRLFFEKHPKAGNKELFCDQIPKDGADIHCTDRRALLNLAYGYMNRITAGRWTPYYYATKVIGQIYEDIKDNLNDEKLKKCVKELDIVRNQSSRMMIEDGTVIDHSGFITDFSGAQHIIEKQLSKKPDIHADFSIDDDNEPRKSFNPDDDRVFIVFDRDYDIYNPQLRSNKEYADIIEKCKKYGYTVLLSTPAFEYWLYLHHAKEGIDFKNIGINLSDVYYIEDELKALEGKHIGSNIKQIKKERFEEYYSKQFSDAVDASLEVATDPMKLINNIGTNVGVELKKLLE